MYSMPVCQRNSTSFGLSARPRLNTCRSQTPYASVSNLQGEQDPHTHTEEKSLGFMHHEHTPLKYLQYTYLLKPN